MSERAKRVRQAARALRAASSFALQWMGARERNAAETEESHNHQLECLADAVSTLPRLCRQVLTLRKVYELPPNEIATRLNVPEHTVERLLIAAVVHLASVALSEARPSRSWFRSRFA